MFTLMKAVHILFILLFAMSLSGLAQEASYSKRNAPNVRTALVQGRIMGPEGTPLNGVNVIGTNGTYAATDENGYFNIRVQPGEELTIRRSDFETVYYKVKDVTNFEITIKDASNYKEQLNNIPYEELLDSAAVYTRKEPQRTADFLIAALSGKNRNLTSNQKAQVYERLGDLYSYYKQADLAISNYQHSLKEQEQQSVTFKLAKALTTNGNYQESLRLLIPLLNKTTTVPLLELTAQTYQATNDLEQAQQYLERALALATTNNNGAAITRINAQLGALLSKKGATLQAEGYYTQAIKVAATQGMVSNLNTNAQTADFYNRSQRYDEEIKLRQNNIELIKNAQSESNTSLEEEVTISLPTEDTSTAIIAQPDTPSIQSEQLKIAAAYRAKNDVKKAIYNFELSLQKAQKEGDLQTQKEAAYNLTTLYKEQRAFNKAIAYQEVYIDVVDQLYAAKEKELAENNRRTQELLNRQTRIATLEKDRELTENQLALAASQQELTNQTNKNQRYIILGLISLSVALLALAYFMWRANQQQRTNNRLLALKSLRSQMNPHFIFNALNSVNNYIALNDERAANKYLARFSKLMRSVLENSELDVIALHKELELVEVYTQLEHERFKDQFDYQIHIDPNISLHEYQVPPMLIQPLVENAVWHGLRYKKNKGELSIQIVEVVRNTSVYLQITITDNGIGRKKSQEIKTDHQRKKNSKGLGNINNRIALLNELKGQQIEVVVNDAYPNQEDVGTRAIIRIKK